jgi:hypothetical protein
MLVVVTWPFWTMVYWNGEEYDSNESNMFFLEKIWTWPWVVLVAETENIKIQR